MSTPDIERQEDAQDIAARREELAARLDEVIAEAGSLYQRVTRLGRELSRQTQVGPGPTVSCNRDLSAVVISLAKDSGLPVEIRPTQLRMTSVRDAVAGLNGHALDSLHDIGADPMRQVPTQPSRRGRGRRKGGG